MRGPAVRPSVCAGAADSQGLATFRRKKLLHPAKEGVGKIQRANKFLVTAQAGNPGARTEIPVVDLGPYLADDPATRRHCRPEADKIELKIG
jgi:hypothetical protein